MSVETILAFNEIDATSYRIGPSQVSQKKLFNLKFCSKDISQLKLMVNVYKTQFVLLYIHEISVDFVSRIIYAWKTKKKIL